jgi:3'(2'), 5'-bisphosphate nucleotidase
VSHHIPTDPDVGRTRQNHTDQGVSLGSALLDNLVEIAQEAAAVVLAIYQGEYAVDWKGPNDPVTTADRCANQHICHALRESFPNCPIVAEESDPRDFGDYRHEPRVFFVDPVDGTQEFIRRTGEFVVMIGCVDDLCASAGVIWAPTLDTVWIGQRGLGAFRRGSNGAFVPIRPTETKDASLARLLVSRSQSSREAETLRTQLNVTRVDALGSAGLKAAAVADGTVDAYVAQRSAGKRWDVCAPDAILSAAGALLTDVNGNAIDYRSEDLENRRGLLAANAELHHELVRRLPRC